MILLAIIASAHGIRGAVKVKTFTSSPTNMLAYGALRDEKGREYHLKLVRLVSSDSLIAVVEGISDRNQAEALRGTKLYIGRHQLPDLVEEEFYHSDLIGLKVQDLEGQDIGRVQAVSNFGAGDFLEVMDADHHLYTISFTREAVPMIRLSEKELMGVVWIDRRFLLDSTIPQTEQNRGEGIEGEEG